MVSARRKWLATGFTLVELMVVLVVLAVAASLVTMSLSATGGHGLASAAEHLASTLEEARWQAISTGRRIAWEAPKTNNPASNAAEAARWYEQTQDGVWRLRVMPHATSLFAGVSLSIAQPRSTDDAPARLVLGPEPVGLASCVLLTQEGRTVAVVSTGITPFAVRHDARC